MVIYNVSKFIQLLVGSSAIQWILVIDSRMRVEAKAAFDPLTARPARPSIRQIGFEWFPEEPKAPLYTEDKEHRQVYTWLRAKWPGRGNHIRAVAEHELLVDVTSKGLASFRDDQYCTVTHETGVLVLSPIWKYVSKVIFCDRGYTVRLFNLAKMLGWTKNDRDIRIRCRNAMEIAWDLARAIDVDMKTRAVTKGTNIGWRTYFHSEDLYDWDYVFTGTPEDIGNGTFGTSYWLADPDWGIVLGVQDGRICPPRDSEDWANITE